MKLDHEQRRVSHTCLFPFLNTLPSSFLQVARVFPALAPLMVQLAANRRTWHARLVAELEGGAGAAAGRPAADRAADVGRAEARAAAFEAAYAQWMAVAEPAAAEGGGG